MSIMSAFFLRSRAARLFVLAAICFGSTSASAEDFAITYPEPRSTVRAEVIEIEGTGAVPGATIEVKVLTNDWYLQDGETTIHENGTWSYGPCHLSGKGRFDSHTIRATLIEDGEELAIATVREVVREN